MNLTNSKSLYGIPSNDDFSKDSIKILPGSFLKGYKAFYIMKYELSERKYVDWAERYFEMFGGF